MNEADANGWYPIKFCDCRIEPGADTGFIPESGEPVFVYNEAEETICRGYLWRGDNWRDHNKDGLVFSWQPYDDDNITYWNPTHWQPFPKPPVSGNHHNEAKNPD